MASGLPDSVPAWYMGPSGATRPMISDGPPYAPTGKPPPMILPMVVRSGRIAYNSCAPPKAMRKPVMTSSKMSTHLSRSVIVRRASRYPRAGGTQPMLPTTGSTITHAIWWRKVWNACSSASVSLNGSAELGAVSRCQNDRFDHRGGCVSQDQWAPGADVINVVVAVGVPDVRTLPPNNEGRIAAHCTKCAYGRIDAAWNHLLGTPLEPARLVKLAGHGSSPKRKQSYQRAKPERWL